MKTKKRRATSSKQAKLRGSGPWTRERSAKLMFARGGHVASLSEKQLASLQRFCAGLDSNEKDAGWTGVEAAAVARGSTGTHHLFVGNVMLRAPVRVQRGKSVRLRDEGSGLQRAIEDTNAHFFQDEQIWAGFADELSSLGIEVDWLMKVPTVYLVSGPGVTANVFVRQQDEDDGALGTKLASVAGDGYVAVSPPDETGIVTLVTSVHAR